MKRKWVGAIFVAPALTLLLVFYIGPILYSFKLGFYDVTLFSSEWAGLTNFIELLRPGPFWAAFRTSLKFLIVILFCDLTIAYLIAVGLSRIAPRLAAVLRVCYYVPVVLSSIATVSVWRWFLRYGGGAFNEVLTALHLPAVTWLGHPQVAPWTLCFVVSIGAIGVSVLLYSAALGQLNEELLDAARIDGANEIQIIWHIITPLVRPTMLYILVTNTIGSFQIWETPYFFTKGGPLSSTTTVAYYIFNTAFMEGEMGQASAMTAVMSVITLVFAWIFIKKMGFGRE